MTAFRDMTPTQPARQLKRLVRSAEKLVHQLATLPVTFFRCDPFQQLYCNSAEERGGTARQYAHKPCWVFCFFYSRPGLLFKPHSRLEGFHHIFGAHVRMPLLRGSRRQSETFFVFPLWLLTESRSYNEVTNNPHDETHNRSECPR